MRPTYPQEWSSYDASQEYEQEYFELWLRDLCDLIEQPDYGFGRPRLPVGDMVYAIGLKTYSGMSRRRTMTSIRRAYQRGLIDHVPSNSTISRYLDDPKLTPILKFLVELSATPLKNVETTFAVDSTGFASTTYDRWFDHKWGRVIRQAQWVKCHLTCGVKTNIVASVEVSGPNANDSPFLLPLLRTAKRNFPSLDSLLADKAYLSKGNFDGSEELDTKLTTPFKKGLAGDSPQAQAQPRLGAGIPLLPLLPGRSSCRSTTCAPTSSRPWT